MKTYIVNYYNFSWENWEKQEYEDIIDYKDEKSLTEYIVSNWYQINFIKEFENEGFFGKLKWFFSRFISFDSYNYQVEEQILLWYADGKVHWWWWDEEAFNYAKSNFPRKAWKKQRDMVDEIIKFISMWQVQHTYQIFANFPNIFSEEIIQMMKSCVWKDIMVDKLITNVVDKKDKSGEMEGYIEIKSGINTLLKEIKYEVWPPILEFITVIILSSLMIFGWLPYFLKIFLWDTNPEDINLGVLWTLLYNFSKVIWDNILIFIILLFILTFLTYFIYLKSENIRYILQKMLLKTPIFWEIIELFMTRKITSIIWMLYNSWSQYWDIRKAVVPTITLLPFKYEIDRMLLLAENTNFENVFNEYSDKNFTEFFYARLIQQSPNIDWASRNYSWDVWNLRRAFQWIIIQCDSSWKTFVRKLPKKLWMFIRTFSWSVSIFIALWLVEIVTYGSINITL